MRTIPRSNIVTSQAMRDTLNSLELINYDKPVGVIGKSSDVQYGFDGETYFVSIGILEYLAFGRMKITFQQAKAVYDAILFFDIDVDNWNFDLAKKVLKDARKLSLSDDDLMFFFGESLK